MNSPHKGQWRGALVFSLICTWINDWVNTPEAGDFRRNCAHYSVTVVFLNNMLIYHSFFFYQIKENFIRCWCTKSSTCLFIILKCLTENCQFCFILILILRLTSLLIYLLLRKPRHRIRFRQHSYILVTMGTGTLTKDCPFRSLIQRFSQTKISRSWNNSLLQLGNCKQLLDCIMMSFKGKTLQHLNMHLILLSDIFELCF